MLVNILLFQHYSCQSRNLLFSKLCQHNRLRPSKDAIDEGGPKREFWRLLALDIKSQLCISSGDRLTIDHDVLCLQVSQPSLILAILIIYNIYIYVYNMYHNMATMWKSEVLTF